MAFQFELTVPWGRSFDEYRRMFQLCDDDLRRRILGYADGPANFNAQMARRGRRVVSVDPLYQLTLDQIEARITDTYEDQLGQARQHSDQFVWDVIKSPDELGRVWLAAMCDFLVDYDQGKREQRYRQAELPALPFESQSFDLALCSHFLFWHTEHNSLAFHRQAVEELCRVALEVRLFPLLTDQGQPCPLVTPLAEYLRRAGYLVSLERVPYEFQRGGNLMMRVMG